MLRLMKVDCPPDQWGQGYVSRVMRKLMKTFHRIGLTLLCVVLTSGVFSSVAMAKGTYMARDHLIVDLQFGERHMCCSDACKYIK